MRRIVIELHIVVHLRGRSVEPANTTRWPRVTAAEIAAAYGLPASEVVRVALGLGIGALAFEPDEVARIEAILGEGGPDGAA